MILSLFLIFIFSITICSSTKSISDKSKINLNCDVRPFNDLHLLNYFLKQQLKNSPGLSNEDLTRKFYKFRATVDLDQLENECEKKSRAKFALIKHSNGKNFELINDSKKKQKNRKKISQRMSLELVNALLLGKLLGLNLGMLSSVIFASVFKPKNGSSDGGQSPGGGGGGDAGGQSPGGGGGGGDAGGGGGGDAGGGDAGGGDSGRFLNYDTDGFSSRFNNQEDEYCDDQLSNEKNYDSSDTNDYQDNNWNYKRNRRRSKRDLFANRKNFISPIIEDNEDLWSNSAGPIYIPTINRFTPDLTNTAVHNHNFGFDLTQFKPKSTLNRNKNENVNQPSVEHFPSSYSFLTPSSFAFSQIPVFYKPSKPKAITPSITTIFHSQKDKSPNRPGIVKQFPNYETNLDNLSFDDYSDELSNRKEEIDLEHKLKQADETNYFDDFEDEFKDKELFDKKFKDLDKNFNKNFDKNFNKDFSPKRTKSKKNLPRNKGRKNKKTIRTAIKKKFDSSKLEHEREDDNDEITGRALDKDLDKKAQKLVRITRQITVYNKNLFEDSFDLRGVDRNTFLNTGENLLKNANLIDANDEEDEKNESKNMPRLKKKKRVRKNNKKGTKRTGDRKKRNRKRILKNSSNSNKKRVKKRRGTKSRREI